MSGVRRVVRTTLTTRPCVRHEISKHLYIVCRLYFMFSFIKTLAHSTIQKCWLHFFHFCVILKCWLFYYAYYRDTTAFLKNYQQQRSVKSAFTHLELDHMERHLQTEVQRQNLVANASKQECDQQMMIIIDNLNKVLFCIFFIDRLSYAPWCCNSKSKISFKKYSTALSFPKQ